MQKNILFVIDNSELLNFKFDDLITDFWLIREFLKRNYKVYVTNKENLFVENAKGCAICYLSYLKEQLNKENEEIFCAKEQIIKQINDFDVVFFRSDPPVDVTYIDSCYVFDFVDREKTLLINDPREVKNFNEKFHINYFSQFVPENIITSSFELIKNFMEKNKEAILKPLNRCFGSGVYYLNNNDKNLNTIVNNMTENGKTPVMIQKYIPEAKNGDKRILLMGEEVLDECILNIIKLKMK